MANTYIIQRTRVVRIHEWLRTRADCEGDALNCIEQNEFEIDESQIIDELEAGEQTEGAVIVDIEEVKDDQS
jgi:hypothetical protein